MINTIMRAASLIAICIVLLQAPVLAQNIMGQKKATPASLARYVKKATVFSFNKEFASRLISNKQPFVELSFEFENKTWTLELEANDIYSKGFFVQDASGKYVDYDRNTSLHYKGKIKGQLHSIAAVNIHSDEINAVLADKLGNINIGGLGDGSGDMVIFRQEDLINLPPFSCEAISTPGTSPLPDLAVPSSFVNSVNTEPVDVYYEADYSCYTGKGSNLTNTIAWVTDLANNVGILYENDSLNVKMSAIKVWTQNDPYSATASTAEALNSFSLAMTNGFPGDLAHLLSRRGLGGGRAYLNILCSSPQYRTGVSGNLDNGITPLPAYSWNSMVITHELGHNIASPHTQSCNWPGGAIDNCYAVEGTCAPGPAPVNGGTIMSYCHLNVGINLSNGFGPLPGELIRNAVRTTTCIYPRISFNKLSETVAEESADTENDCLDYKLVTIHMKINYTPSEVANIQLLPTALSAGLDIGPGKDIEVASALNFTLADTGSRNIVFKVYDDALIENGETFRLDYNIAANGTNAVKGNLYNMTISSADHRPDSANNQLVWYEPFESAEPLNGWTQNILHGVSSPNRWIVGNSGDARFSGKSLFISNNNGNLAYSGSSVSDSSVIRIITPAINATGFYGLKLSYLYKCLGEGIGGQGTVSTGVDYGKLLYSANNGITWTLIRDNIYSRNFIQTEEIILPPSADNNPAVKLAFEWRNNSSVVNNPPLAVDSIIVTGAGPGAIQSEAHISNSDTAYVGPGATVHFYNQATGKVMATIKNLSAFDFGCTQVDLIRTGTSASQAWSAAVADQLTNKVFRITPTNNSLTASYELSLYSTAEELNGWMAETGNAANDLNIIKSSTDITQTPPATYPVYGTANGNNGFGFAGHRVIKGTFAGFSWFSLGRSGLTGTCPGSSRQFMADVAGTGYQWQLDTGSGFNNISNGLNYAGSNSATLTLSDAPASWYGNRYRCLVNTPAGPAYSRSFELKFYAVWKGSISNAWELPGNWECGVLPDGYTDVYIPGGTMHSPRINTNTSVRTLQLLTGADLTTQPGAQLTILR